MTASLFAEDFAYELNDSLVLARLHATPGFRLEGASRRVVVRRRPGHGIVLLRSLHMFAQIFEPVGFLPFWFEFAEIDFYRRRRVWIENASFFAKNKDAIHDFGLDAFGESCGCRRYRHKFLQLSRGFPPMLLQSRLCGGQLHPIDRRKLLLRSETFVAHRGSHEPKQAHRRHEHRKQQKHDRPDITVLAGAQNCSDDSSQFGIAVGYLFANCAWTHSNAFCNCRSWNSVFGVVSLLKVSRAARSCSYC